jgi:glycosyltransferase involved in cell wall biosynthesis
MCNFELSIIVPTKSRTIEVKELLRSIISTNYKNLEVIIVDQNVVDNLSKIISEFSDFISIKHIRTDAKGAAHARNIGVKESTGKYLCFPDDDCKFLPDTINVALSLIINHDVVFGKCTDEFGKDSVLKFAEGEAVINMNNYNSRFIEATMYIKREIMLDCPYDESLGVGTFHGAEEAYDLVLRFLKLKKKLYYSSSIVYYHPNKILDYNSTNEIKRVFSYRCGFAKLCIKHKMYHKYIKRIILVFFAIFFYILFNKKRVRYYFSELFGLLSGVIVR